MSILDHAFIILFAVVYPVSGYFSFKRLKRRVAAGEPVDRPHLYNMTLLGHWALFAIGLVIWFMLDRNWTDLGFGLSLDAGFFTGAVLTAAGIVLLIVQLRQVANASTEEARKLRSQIDSVEMLLPRNGSELGRFNLLAVTAGIVEEMLWRGFLIWYLGQFMPLWAAAVISAVGFGIGHAYQGARNVPRITAVGAGFVIVFLVSGSLWLPIVLHAAIDLLQGRTLYELLNRNGIDDTTDAGDNAVSA